MRRWYLDPALTPPTPLFLKRTHVLILPWPIMCGLRGFMSIRGRGVGAVDAAMVPGPCPYPPHPPLFLRPHSLIHVTVPPPCALFFIISFFNAVSCRGRGVGAVDAALVPGAAPAARRVQPAGHAGRVRRSAGGGARTVHTAILRVGCRTFGFAGGWGFLFGVVLGPYINHQWVTLAVCAEAQLGAGVRIHDSALFHNNSYAIR